MSFPRFASFSCFAALVLAYSGFAGDSLPGYLIKEVKLAESLEVFDLQGGVAGFTGSYVRIMPEGNWSTGKIFNENLTEEGYGKLTTDQITTMGKTLAANEALKLTGEGDEGVNPHVITIRFGNTEATLNLPAGQQLPKVDSGAGKRSVEQRFAAIIQTARELTAKKDEKKKDK